MKLSINGKTYELEVASDMPVLWVLRDELGLTGTKYSCGIGQCGSCTIHINGKAVRACMTPVGTIGDKKITTIEGLGNDAELHPVQQAWMSEDVPQCGYCQSGQIMQAVALLNENPNPSETEIHQAMKGNLCRCGTYVRIKRAIQLTAQQLLNS